MVRFLSPEWLAALERSLAGIAALTTASSQLDLVIQQVVLGAGSYSITLRDGTVTVTPGMAEHADITFTCGLDTALAVAQGTRNAQDAFAAGELRLGGDVATLVRVAPTLAAVGDAFASLRAATDWSAPPA